MQDVHTGHKDVSVSSQQRAKIAQAKLAPVLQGDSQRVVHKLAEKSIGKPGSAPENDRARLSSSHGAVASQPTPRTAPLNRFLTVGRNSRRAEFRGEC